MDSLNILGSPRGSSLISKFLQAKYEKIKLLTARYSARWLAYCPCPATKLFPDSEIYVLTYSGQLQLIVSHYHLSYLIVIYLYLVIFCWKSIKMYKLTSPNFLTYISEFTNGNKRHCKARRPGHYACTSLAPPAYICHRLIFFQYNTIRHNPTEVEEITAFEDLIEACKGANPGCQVAEVRSITFKAESLGSFGRFYTEQEPFAAIWTCSPFHNFG